MACILRVGGCDLDIDALLKTTDLEVNSVWTKGEQRCMGSKTGGRVSSSSGLRIVVSEADMSDIAGQMDDALRFFQGNRQRIAKIVGFPGVEWAVADFGAEVRPPGWASFSFPAVLAVAIGEAGVSIELSVYPVDDSEEDE